DGPPVNADLVVVLALATLGVAAVLIYLIRILFKLRVEEMHTRLTELHERLSARLSDEDVDRIAARVAEQLARRDHKALERAGDDRKLLLDLARMNENEFEVY